MNFEDELQEKSLATPPEREISLGTPTILGIFLALTLIGAAIFGFGYSLGKRSAQPVTAASPDAGASPKPDSTFSNFKAAPVAEAPANTDPAPIAAAPAQQTTEEAPARETETAKAPPKDTPPPVSTAVQPPVVADGSWMVQVSAATHKPDAESLMGVLTRQGFTTTINQGPDQKFHVRVGPFANKKDADTARKLLIDKGYKEPFLSSR